jgi:Fic family protein
MTMGEAPLIPRMTPWRPRYTLTPTMARSLMEIEAARTVVEQVPLPPAVHSEMRNRARLRSTHHSTRIEGNRLTLAEAEQVLAGRKLRLHGRERDIGEVR